MYEPEKILVQNAGIDPGVAALLQIPRFQILMMKLCRKVSFQYQDRTDVNQSMYLLVVMENLRNYQYLLNAQ